MASEVVQLDATNKTNCTEICRTCSREIIIDEEACEIENNLAKPELPQLLKRYVPGLVSGALISNTDYPWFFCFYFTGYESRKQIPLY